MDRQQIAALIRVSNLDLDALIEINDASSEGYTWDEFIELWTIYREERKRVN